MPPSKTSIEQVHTFPQLVKYLRDELKWPIESDNYDEISWDYDPAELGLKPNEAAKIDYIRQMRPLTDKQPFGIFFVKFSKGRLPVVALRRILSNLVVKRRAGANRADRPAWEMNDLLFLSSWGGNEQRQMNFAHFSDNDSRRDLPTLKVLDWGEHNTRLHVRDVDHRLRQNLEWPEDTTNQVQWRETWRSAFRIRHRETIDTAKVLSIRLAELARAIRDRISDALAIETDMGPFTTLLRAFQQGLVHDLDEEGFADMYAQTIAYGLLSARIADPNKKTADDFAAHMRTSPFLRDLMATFLAVGGRKGKAGGPGIDFDELGVSDVVDLLDEANIEAVVRDFGDKNRQEDPVVHFYERFLQEYNKQLKIQRGVFYTPQPVVSYIVRSVHELLQTEFGLPDGLADTTTWGEMLEQHKNLQLPLLTDDPGEERTTSPDEFFVQILDPATGTATFLVEVIDVIHKTMTAKWKQQGKKANAIAELWNYYVPNYLLPRLHAYELMMAPYAIAHMKVGLKLAETGYRFEIEQRARIYLTNALEPWQKQLKLPDFAALAHETAAVNNIKRDSRFTVVIGNPPYAGHSANKGSWIRHLVNDYYHVDGLPLGERNSKWLQDDYVKFMRLGQQCVHDSSVGILSFITNHGYIDNPTFRGMRKSFMGQFPRIDILDLHGSSIKKERAPDGGKDENVFEIKQGVAIFAARIFIGESRKSLIRHDDMYGLRDEKYAGLLESTFNSRKSTITHPLPPFYLLLPQEENLRAEYAGFENITSALPTSVLGFQTHRDSFAIDLDFEALEQRIEEFRGTSMSDSKVKKIFDISDNRDWNVKDARRQLRDNKNWREPFMLCSYRPFDRRPCYFSTVTMDYPRRELLDHVAGKENLCLGIGRQGSAVQDPIWSLISISRDPVDANIFRRGGINIFPLYLYAKEAELGLHSSRQPNFSKPFLNALTNKLGVPQTREYSLPEGVSAEDILYYIFAVFHSLKYRSRYSVFLRSDFPRLPLTGSLELFHAMINLGAELAGLHLMESIKLENRITHFVGKSQMVTKIGWTPDDGGTVWLDGKGTAKNFQPGTSGFRPVPAEVWNFYIGGYRVCEKWLKDRGPKQGKSGRTLSKEDIAHYHKIVIALTETIRIVAEIDEVIDRHGGWPGAFVTKDEALPKAAEDAAGYGN